MEPKRVPACLLFHLRIVRIDYFWFTEQEFNMVRYILRNAKVLRMEIHSKGEGIDLKEKSEVLKRISLFKWECVECELAFD
ncbi:putative fbd-associated F-box protein at3g50710 [Phtheirospermum japonicum]|uniref:Putative fbd-associated F-box protein at3g50710 n=1 Tax=Phtheirospermum japonicum TaxID=374723 RepID=A0A830CJP1_9LAMI|nr:putative fbd-associated F-box protein at3g50710 [Phtheirospermum japonicum]